MDCTTARTRHRICQPFCSPVTSGDSWEAEHVWFVKQVSPNVVPCPVQSDTFKPRLPSGMPGPKGALHLTGTGRFAPAELADGQVRTAQPLRQWELVVLSSESIDSPPVSAAAREAGTL